MRNHRRHDPLTVVDSEPGMSRFPRHPQLAEPEPRMTIRPTALAVLLIPAALALGACSQDQSTSEAGGSGTQQASPSDENVVTGTVPEERVETDSDPTAQSGTGGPVPEGPRDQPAN